MRRGLMTPDKDTWTRDGKESKAKDKEKGKYLNYSFDLMKIKVNVSSLLANQTS